MSHPIFMVLNPIFCYVSPPIVNIHEPHIVETCKKCHWMWHALNPKYVPLKQFWCIFPSQYQQNVTFWLFAELPLTKNWKKCQFTQGKSVCKGFQICAYWFLGMPIIMHYVRTFVLLWFFCIFMGRSGCRVDVTWCRGKMGPKEDCCISTIPFSWFWTPFSAMCHQQLWIFMNHILQRLCKTCSIGFDMPWTLNMYHSSHFDAFFPVNINKIWHFGCLLNSPWQKTEKNVNLPREKVFAKASKSVHIGFWVCRLHNALCENFVWQVLFELLWFFCIFMGRSGYRVL